VIIFISQSRKALLPFWLAAIVNGTLTELHTHTYIQWVDWTGWNAMIVMIWRGQEKYRDLRDFPVAGKMARKKNEKGAGLEGWRDFHITTAPNHEKQKKLITKGEQKTRTPKS